MKRDPALTRAIEAAGSLRALAEGAGRISHQAISMWQRVPAEWVVRIEKASGVPRHELRPDLFAGYRRVV